MLSISPFRWISQYYFGFFFVYGIYTPFWALWLKSEGVAPTDIGLIMGLAFGTRCLANLLITPKVHRAEWYVPMLRVLTLLAIGFIAAHIFAVEHLIWIALVTILFNSCFGPIIPLSDTVANYYTNMKMLDYGRTRLWGSVAFIVGSLVVGWIVAHWGNDWILYTALLGMSVTFLISLRAPNPNPVTHTETQVVRPKLIEMLRDKQVIKFLVLVSLIQGSHAAYYSFSSVYWKSVGHSEEIIGYLWSLGVIAEICIFALSRRLFGSWSIRGMFLLSSCAVVVRWSLTASTTEIAALVFIQLLHSLTFAVAHLATIRYIQQAVPEKMVALQSLYNAIPLGAVIATMTAISGWGFESWGANIFWGMALMGVVALFVRLEPRRTVRENRLNSAPGQG
ncbi:3-phenylpropionate MFS transporter [Vibrio spartinae]|uniref:3-phenylpropionic acid transporter n=1 Tax=Vibrio spartinae TaxID=1918945 RepID=A0A1N6M516_9VIBR|nr:3-phenylpropionate MFS transporter [Vibrio spartinae]QMV15774.1 putative 3-phenylpropionic acid transporter [Vibrio spartinae]SIO94446.1 putative 3-phenylpropionic acid transporter [Vibrio spartinae]